MGEIIFLNNLIYLVATTTKILTAPVLVSLWRGVKKKYSDGISVVASHRISSK
jgi:hypothetical protein